MQETRQKTACRGNSYLNFVRAVVHHDKKLLQLFSIDHVVALEVDHVERLAELDLLMFARVPNLICEKG